jgi:hypothetical protein
MAQNKATLKLRDSLIALLATRFMLELEEKGRDRKRSRPVSDGCLPSTGPTLVASEAPTSALRGDDSASSLNVGLDCPFHIPFNNAFETDI